MCPSGYYIGPEIEAGAAVLSGVVSKGAMAPPDFVRSVNPILNRRGRLCLANYYWDPRISKLS